MADTFHTMHMKPKWNWKSNAMHEHQAHLSAFLEPS